MLHNTMMMKKIRRKPSTELDGRQEREIQFAKNNINILALYRRLLKRSPMRAL